MAEADFLPGSKAMLVYQDKRGVSRSSIVELVSLDSIHIQNGWRAIKARKEVFDCVFNITPIQTYKFDIEEGWAVSLVSEERLAPLGTRVFHIVQ